MSAIDTGGMFMVGVTGTNGKTSVTQWIAQAFAALGRKCAVIGTLGNGFPGALVLGPNTTPGAAALRQLLPDLVMRGATACAMEVSSIGLHQKRVDDIAFDVAVFTNFTRDHLDYHGTMDSYAAEKRKLFDLPGLKTAVVNLDDPFGEQLDAELAGRLRVIGYTLATKVSRGETLAARDLTTTATGIAFMVNGVRMAAPVIGRFNAANLLACLGALLTSDVPLADALTALSRVQPVAGRMQRLGGAGQPDVIVDYAHTPDALDKTLATLRDLTTGRLICVFGCGGGRDKGKRPIMGGVAASRADLALVTSDNPRNEDPAAIVADILAGMPPGQRVLLDRAEAIRLAIGEAKTGDVVLIAGKGHEDYQEIQGTRLPFSDMNEARRALREKTHAPA